ncbi:MAG: deoxyribonuclease IV [Candidatus Bathyarchaeia archaeon]
MGWFWMRLGMHVSISGSLDLAVDRAEERGCNTFQMFTRNPRAWRFRGLIHEEVGAFIRKVEGSGMEPVVAHMPYLPNLASARDDIYEKSVRSLKAELRRCEQLKVPYLVTHLGSHLGRGMSFGSGRIVNSINRAFSEVENDVMLLLENTSGSKNSMGTHFTDIGRIIDQLERRDRVGVCFDTSHAFAAGYDLRSDEVVEDTMREFEEVIGLERLRVVHLNDSKAGLGTGIDRHEHIGLGEIGEEGFKAILRHRGLRGLPLILETPITSPGDDVRNLEKVRELYRLANPNY